jgi:hypothetical protein
VLGPSDGRYLLRDGADEQPGWIVVLQTLGAPQRRMLERSRRARSASPEPAPTPVTTARATIIDANDRFAGEQQASAWLRGLDVAAHGRLGLLVLNRMLHAQRIATANPYVHELSGEDAIVLRVGFGEGEKVAYGEWTEARELPRTAIEHRVRRSAALRPQERLAALLGAHDRALACEELALRARLDLDHGRPLAAALGTRLALEAAVVELVPSAQQLIGLNERLEELRMLREGVDAAAAAALAGELSEEHAEIVAHALRRVEAALRARTAIGMR